MPVGPSPALGAGLGKYCCFLYESCVFVYGLPYDIFYIVPDMPFGVFVQFFRIDRFPVFNDHMGLFYLRQMVFKDLGCVVHGDRDDRAAAFCRDLERAVFKWEQGQLFAAVAGPLGENADGDASLDIVDRSEDSLETFFWVLSVKEEAVYALHPGRQCEIAFHLFFCDIAGQPFASAVSEQDVKITAVVPDKKDRFIGDVFFSDDRRPDAGHTEDHFESPLYDAQGTDVSGVRIKFPDDPFSDQDRDGQDEIQDQKDYDTDKTKHILVSIFHNNSANRAKTIIQRQRRKNKTYAGRATGPRVTDGSRRGDCSRQPAGR